MAKLSDLLGASNPITQMKAMDSYGQMRLGNNIFGANVIYNPTQRLDNQIKTSSQVQNYSQSKNMAEQRMDMRGNVAGYSDTLG